MVNSHSMFILDSGDFEIVYSGSCSRKIFVLVLIVFKNLY